MLHTNRQGACSVEQGGGRSHTRRKKEEAATSATVAARPAATKRSCNSNRMIDILFDYTDTVWCLSTSRSITVEVNLDKCHLFLEVYRNASQVLFWSVICLQFWHNGANHVFTSSSYTPTGTKGILYSGKSGFILSSSMMCPSRNISLQLVQQSSLLAETTQASQTYTAHIWHVRGAEFVSPHVRHRGTHCSSWVGRTSLD